MLPFVLEQGSQLSLIAQLLLITYLFLPDLLVKVLKFNLQFTSHLRWKLKFQKCF